ncbi:DUF3073 domain-containing protein [Leifsonia sp. YAF41]|uniref:DUF3073 domain-containing protein n=1 Tax=Leifsonia sp. YAF41 TaxID=3233086 RepID=UPI003F9713A9
MGRGRQKAKHTKVARELKYFSPDTNYNALERELTGHPSDDPRIGESRIGEDRLDEDLAKWPEYEPAESDDYVDHYAPEDEQKRA